MTGTAYLETSAILTWLLGEPKADEALAAIDSASTIVTSVLSLLEVERVLIRAERLGDLNEGQAQRLRGQCRRVSDGWIRMNLTEEVRERAARVFPVEPVRTLDALHLASALVFTKAFPDLKLLSFDERILSNARALGIS